MSAESKKEPDQFERFLETARALGCDEDKEKFEAQLGKIAEHKPAMAERIEEKASPKRNTGEKK